MKAQKTEKTRQPKASTKQTPTFLLELNGIKHMADDEPAESSSGLFGGNSKANSQRQVHTILHEITQMPGKQAEL